MNGTRCPYVYFDERWRYIPRKLWNLYCGVPSNFGIPFERSNMYEGRWGGIEWLITSESK